MADEKKSRWALVDRTIRVRVPVRLSDADLDEDGLTNMELSRTEQQNVETHYIDAGFAASYEGGVEISTSVTFHDDCPLPLRTTGTNEVGVTIGNPSDPNWPNGADQGLVCLGCKKETDTHIATFRQMDLEPNEKCKRCSKNLNPKQV